VAEHKWQSCLAQRQNWSSGKPGIRFARLRQLANATWVERASEALEPAQQELAQRCKKKDQTAGDLATLIEAMDIQRADYRAAQQRVQRLDVDIAGLKGQVQSHSALKGNSGRPFAIRHLMTLRTFMLPR
jgi:hypothetical protein